MAETIAVWILFEFPGLTAHAAIFFFWNCWEEVGVCFFFIFSPWNSIFWVTHSSGDYNKLPFKRLFKHPLLFQSIFLFWCLKNKCLGFYLMLMTCLVIFHYHQYWRPDSSFQQVSPFSVLPLSFCRLLQVNNFISDCLSPAPSQLWQCCLPQL